MAPVPICRGVPTEQHEAAAAKGPEGTFLFPSLHGAMDSATKDPVHRVDKHRVLMSWKQAQGSEIRCAEEENGSDGLKLCQASRHAPQNCSSWRCGGWPQQGHVHAAPSAAEIRVTSHLVPLVKNPEHKILLSATALTGVHN